LSHQLPFVVDVVLVVVVVTAVGLAVVLVIVVVIETVADVLMVPCVVDDDVAQDENMRTTAINKPTINKILLFFIIFNLHFIILIHMIYQ
jgi:hypothetical protein